MVQLSKNTSRLLARVGNEKWATPSDHEPVQSDEAFINGEPLSSSDSEDANEKANIPPSRVTSSAKRKAHHAKESRWKLARTGGVNESPRTADTRDKGSARRAEYKPPDQLQFGRDDVIFGAQGARLTKRRVKTFNNIHTSASMTASKDKPTETGRSFQKPPEARISTRPDKSTFKAPPTACEKWDDEELASVESGDASDSSSKGKSSTMGAKKSIPPSNKSKFRVPTGRPQTAAEAPLQKPRATFKSYVLSQTVSNSSPSSPPTSAHPSGRTGFTPEPDNAPEPNSIDTKCPMCGSEVGFLELEIFRGECKGTRPTVREQQRFCLMHKKNEAEEIWEARGYPSIDWDRLSDRFSRYHPNINRLLANPQEAYFRREMDKRAKHGNARTLLQQMEKEGFDEVSLGYYGTRGLDMIMDHIMSKFSERIRKLAGSDRTIANRGPSGYVQMVLAPELATLLIMEDMSVSEQGAREIMKESIDVGDLLHGKEEGDHRKVESISPRILVGEEDGEDDWTRTQLV